MEEQTLRGSVYSQSIERLKPLRRFFRPVGQAQYQATHWKTRNTDNKAISYWKSEKPFMTASRFDVRRAGRFFLFSVTIKSLCFFWASLQVCHSCII